MKAMSMLSSQLLSDRFIKEIDAQLSLLQANHDENIVNALKIIQELLKKYAKQTPLAIGAAWKTGLPLAFYSKTITDDLSVLITQLYMVVLHLNGVDKEEIAKSEKEIKQLAYKLASNSSVINTFIELARKKPENTEQKKPSGYKRFTSALKGTIKISSEQQIMDMLKRHGLLNEDDNFQNLRGKLLFTLLKLVADLNITNLLDQLIEVKTSSNNKENNDNNLKNQFGAFYKQVLGFKKVWHKILSDAHRLSTDEMIKEAFEDLRDLGEPKKLEEFYKVTLKTVEIEPQEFINQIGADTSYLVNNDENFTKIFNALARIENKDLKYGLIKCYINFIISELSMLMAYVSETKSNPAYKTKFIQNLNQYVEQLINNIAGIKDSFIQQMCIKEIVLTVFSLNDKDLQVVLISDLIRLAVTNKDHLAQEKLLKMIIHEISQLTDENLKASFAKIIRDTISNIASPSLKEKATRITQEFLLKNLTNSKDHKL